MNSIGRPERVLVLTNIYPTCTNQGGASFVTSRVEAMRQLGVHVDVVAVGPRLDQSEDRRPVGMAEVTVPISFPERVLLRLPWYENVLVSRIARRLAAEHAVSDYDLLMAHGMFPVGAGSVARKLSVMSLVPHTIHLHGSDVNYVMPRMAKRYAKILGQASFCFFVSEALRQKASSLGYAGSNWLVPGNGVDAEVFKVATGSRLGFRFLFVGNLLPVKGADRLIEIFRRITRINGNAELIIVGDGDLRSRMEDEAKGLPVTFRGRLSREEVAHEMARAGVLLIPSRNEGWPTVINESYATGTPVVASDVGGVREALFGTEGLVAQGEGFEERFAQAAVTTARSANPSILRARALEFSWVNVVDRELSSWRSFRMGEY